MCRSVIVKISAILFVVVIAVGVACLPGKTTYAATDVEINETNFPDDNFRNWVLSQDYGQDGKLTESEISDVIKIEVSGKHISNLKGIEYFTSLEYLSCSHNALKSLDLSKNTVLKELHCYSAELTSLDVSKNIALNKLECLNNQLTDLDVSKNTELTDLSCDYNRLTSLDVSKNTKLKVLYCISNQLISLDVSKNTELTELNCTSNQLTNLDVSKNTELTYIYCSSNQLTNLDVSKNVALQHFDCYSNQLTVLDVSKNTELIEFNCSSNQLAVIDVSKNTELAYFECSSNQLTSLDMSKSTKLIELRCNSNKLTSLDVSKNTALWLLNCRDNGITNLFLPTLSLRYYYDTGVNLIVVKDGEIAISDLNFPDVNFRNWVLSQDYGQDCKLTEAEIADVTSIDVYCQNISNLKGIEFFISLTELDCCNNQLSSLDVSKNTALTRLYCHNNQLISLDMSKNTVLENFECHENKLNSLNVSNNVALKRLCCDYNNLTSIDVSYNNALEVLHCNDNQLTDLDVSKNTALKDLNCSSNQLTSLDYRNTSLSEINYDKNPLEILNGDILINEYTFPDVKFRNWILSQAYGQDGKLTESEIAAVTWINVNGKGVSNLKGIEFFISLTELDCCNNQLSSLDVSKNTALTRLYCHNNQLISLDVSKNTALENFECHENKLNSLNVSNNVALKRLCCDYNNLTSLDVSCNNALVELHCNDNKLTDLDVNKNTALKDLNCSSNQLTNLDVSKNTALECLSCESNQLTSLDVSCNNALVELDCNDNQLTDLDVSNNSALNVLKCSSNQLKKIDVSKNTALSLFACASNQLTSLDVSENIELVYLDCTCEKLDKVYVHSDTEYFIEKHENTRVIVISKDDFEYNNIVCSGNAADGYQLAAEYVCTKDEDYKITIPVQFTIDSVSPANCVDPEKTTFMVRLSAQDAYDGKEILTKATFDTAPSLGHDWKDATCTEPKTCKRCQVTEGNANGHNWGSWTVTTPAKVNEKGVETRKCLACGKEETRDIEAVKPTATPTATSAPKPTTTTPVPTNGPSTKPTTAPVVSVALDKKSDSIVCGKTLSLKATLKGTDSKISWKSADSKIASVDSNGKITAKQAGRVTITASAAGKSAACVVTVLYKDVTNTKDFWFAPTNYLTAANVVKGYDKQTNFKPANDCTRAQMVTFLWRLAGEPAPKATTSNFKDIKKTDYFYKPVLWAVEKGITTGVSKTKFDPKGVCTRAQTVTFLWRMAKKPDPKSAKNKFSDVKSKDYFYKAVLWASEKKIVAGYSDGTFKPQGKCLRRQMVTFLYKYDKFVNGKG